MDEDIRALVGQGQRDAALARVLPAHRDKVFALCFGILGDAASAEDVAQEVFVKIWRALPLFDGRSSLSTWIYAIARNAALSARRSRRALVSLSEPEALAETEAATAIEPQARVDAAASADQLHAWLKQLPEKQRQVVTLFYMQDCSHDEMSEMLGMPVGTIKNLLHRGREQLRLLAGVST